jgi:hypothetical protein
MEVGLMFTVGELARRLNVPLHRVEYKVTKLGIAPVARVGNLRVFNEAALDQLRRELVSSYIGPHITV